jgi:ketosteroid isomerase-like protein
MPSEQTTPRPPAPDVPEWVRAHYRLVDAAAVETYVEDFAEDVELRFGSQPPIVGRAKARDALAGGHARHTMQHTIVGFFEDGATAIAEFDVLYTFSDGATSRRPSCAVMHRNDDGLIDSLHVYLEPPRPGD